MCARTEEREWKAVIAHIFHAIVIKPAAGGIIDDRSREKGWLSETGSSRAWLGILDGG